MLFFALACLAQQTNAGRPSANASAALPEQPGSSLQSWQRVSAAATAAQPGPCANSLERKTATRAARDLEAVSFLSPVLYDAGAENSNSIAIADMNGDGNLDLVVSNCDPLGSGGCGFIRDGVVGVLLGIGDGSFVPVGAYDSGGNLATSVAVADVNGDGHPDIIVTHLCDEENCEKQAGVSVLLGNGDGTFGAAATYSSGGLESFSVAIADVNGDGKADLLIANTCAGIPCNIGGGGVVSVLLGNGDGTFQAPVSYDSGDIGPKSIAAVDLRGNGKIDVLVANSGAADGGFFNSGSFAVLLGNGDGTFQAPVTYPVGPNPWSLAVADVNGDGKLDAVLADSCWCGHDAELAVLLGNGDGTFQPAVTYDSGNSDTVSVAVADLNGDGYPDLLAGGVGGPGLSVLMGNGDGTFQPVVFFYPGGGIESIGTADLNGDGLPDVVSTDGYYASVMLNNTGSSQAPTTASLTSSLNPSTYGQSVTFTVQVATTSGTPTGTVIFYAGTTALGSAALSSGSASLSTSSLSSGSQSITAAYQGSASLAPSASPALNQIVNGTITTATSLSSSRGSIVAGKPVAFTATVTSGSGTPVGAVILYDSTTGAAIGSASLVGGTASLSTASLSPGSHSITAEYQGADSFAVSTSTPWEHRVSSDGPFPSQTRLATSGSPTFAGQPVTFSATVTARTGAIPDGEVVTFYNEEHHQTIGSGTTAGGVASFTTSSLTAAKYTIKATYAGDVNFVPSSGAVSQVVQPYSTTTALSSSLNPSAYKQAVTFTATVTSAGPDTPTGKVVFKDGTSQIGTVTLTAGVAMVTKSNLAVGTHSITAHYEGDGESGESTSPILSQVVN
jgi:Bacterial Ig-like domain (group 3)/FG-GAP-like repeat